MLRTNTNIMLVLFNHWPPFSKATKWCGNLFSALRPVCYSQRPLLAKCIESVQVMRSAIWSRKASWRQAMRLFGSTEFTKTKKSKSMESMARKRLRSRYEPRRPAGWFWLASPTWELVENGGWSPAFISTKPTPAHRRTTQFNFAAAAIPVQKMSDSLTAHSRRLTTASLPASGSKFTADATKSIIATSAANQTKERWSPSN